MSDPKDAGKRNAAIAAAGLVRDGMTLGIGTGSTAKAFISVLKEKTADGWRLQGVPTSEETREYSIAAGIDIITPDEATVIHLAVDGADEADPSLNLIKGGGGALLREKIVARAAERFVVIADKSKRVAHLGAFPLPVEIEPFGWALTVKAVRAALSEAGYKNAKIALRSTDGAFAATDGGNLLLDCALERIDDPAALDAALNVIPGVVENGLFCNMADTVIFGDADGVTVDGAPVE